MTFTSENILLLLMRILMVVHLSDSFKSSLFFSLEALKILTLSLKCFYLIITHLSVGLFLFEWLSIHGIQSKKNYFSFCKNLRSMTPNSICPLFLAFSFLKLPLDVKVSETIFHISYFLFMFLMSLLVFQVTLSVLCFNLLILSLTMLILYLWHLLIFLI